MNQEKIDITIKHELSPDILAKAVQTALLDYFDKVDFAGKLEFSFVMNGITYNGKLAK